jgi:N-acetylmuramoyl-L-alanine amidase
MMEMTDAFVTCISIGHGGPDMGAIALDGTPEKKINLALGEKLDASLIGTSIVPVLDRKTDICPTWAVRYQIARDAGAKFILAVHANSSKHPHLRHAEAYHYPGNDRAAEVGEVFVQSVPEDLRSRKVRAATDLEGQDDDWLQRPLKVINAFGPLPVLVAEVGYISNHRDLEIIQSRWGLDAIVCGLRAALIRAAQLYGG